jgi:hypothetical protein
MKKPNTNAQTADTSSKPVLKIDWATHEAAKYACENWHYSKCVPQGALIKIGAWENGKFIGVIIFGRGATNELGSPYGLKNTQVCELVRISLTKHQTTVSRIMTIAIKMLKKKDPGLRLIVSFADSNEGHHGGIYQATNWIYSGRSPDCKFPVINGKTVHPRVLSHMISDGRIKNRKQVPTVMKRGKHRYLMPLDDEMRKKVQCLAKPYPKRASSKEIVAPCDQQGESGVNPTDALQISTEKQ